MPTIKIRTIHECEKIKSEWNDLASSPRSGIQNLGASSTFEWTKVLINNHASDKKNGVLIGEKNNKILLIFPYYEKTYRYLNIIKTRSIEQIQEMYASRNGLILANNNYLHVDALLKFLCENKIQWDTFVFSIVSNNEHEMEINRLIDGKNLKHIEDAYIESPYLKLPENHDHLMNKLDKKFRYNVISRLKRLKTKGDVELKVYDSSSQVEEFISIVYNIEKKSWKEKAGTSITTNQKQEDFYNNFTRLAASNGWLMGFVIFHGKNPMAYSYGLFFNGVFESLKSSFSDDFKQYGPGNIIKYEITRYLCAHGIKYYDLLGVKDSMKMKWTSKTYTQKHYTIFNKNIKGRAIYSAIKVKKFINNTILKKQNSEDNYESATTSVKNSDSNTAHNSQTILAMPLVTTYIDNVEFKRKIRMLKN